MNSTPRDAQAPSYRECLLPSVARTPSVTQVTPAKKITFLKRGDPRFSGVRLAVHQRTFKSFGTLMDELSQRVPLSFGVRSVTTPRGLHGLSALEQLEDGGCYLCSDKKPPKTSSGPGRPQGGSPSTQQSQDVEGQGEAPGTSSSRKNPKAPKRIMLVKNGDPRFQQTVVLSHRNTRSLSTFLSKASDLLHFPVRQVYTTNGKKVDSLKALLHSPPVLVCAGPESFRPPAAEGVRRGGTETLSGQTSRSKSGSWGPKAKQSVIHSRSRSGSRPRQFPLLSDRSGLSDPRVSLHHSWMGPDPDMHPQDTPAQLGPLVASDDVEKKVHVNEDGSLSVEMKVRFHLLGNDMLLWSRRVSRASALTAATGEGHPGGSLEPGTQAVGTQEAACKEAFERGRWQPGSRYEIWMNPLYAAQGEGTAAQSRARPAPHGGGRWSRGVAGRKSSCKDSDSPASSDRPPEGSEPNSSCCSRSPEGSMGSCDLHLSSRATSQKGPGWAAGGTPPASGGPGPERGELGSRDPCCLKPRTRRVTGALSDSSASAGSHEEPSEGSEQHQGCRSKTRAMTSPRKATHAGGPHSSTMHLSSLGNEDPWAEGNVPGPGHMQARDACGTRQPLASGRFGSGDTAEGCSLSSTCISATGGRRKQESRGSAVASPSISGLGQRPQRGHPRQHSSQRDAHCPLDSPVCRQTQGPPSAGRGCPVSPAPHFPGSSSSARNPVSWDPELPRSTSLPSQGAWGVSSAPLTAVSDSDCASDLCPAHSPFIEMEGNPEFRAHSPCNSWDSFSSQANGQGENAGGNVPKPSWPLPLPVGQHEVGKSRAQQEGYCSEMGISGVCRTPCVETHTQPQGSPEPISEAHLVCIRHCPTPPRAQSSVQKHGLPRSSNGNHGGSGGTALGEEQLDAQRPRPPGSQSGGPGRAVRAARRGSPGARPGRMCQGQAAGGGAGLEEQEDKGSVTLGSLPRASPEAVVREWLSNIPEEPEPVKYETVDDRLGMARGGLEGSTEDPADRHSPQSLGEPTQARHPSLERATSEKAEPEGALPVTGDAGPQPGEGLPHSRVSEAPMEDRAGEVAAGDCAVGQCVLPRRVSASVQVMKALMGSKQGRPSSLPEVSSPVGRRLSHSAQALIMCLTKLHFFDEELGSSTSKVRFTDSPRYQELLSTFQALWPRCGLRPGEQDSGLRELSRCQALPGLRSQAVTENFTPTSSSGVDVGSGSGGSGEGRGPCAVDCALVSERIDLPLKIPHQRPDSRTSENPEELGRLQLSGCMASSSSQEQACATRKGKAKGSSGEQRLDGNLDQVVESTMQEEAVQLAKIIEEEERAELQGEAVSGFPEEERAVGQELSGAGSQEGEGARDDESVQEEEAGRDLVSTMLRPARRGETRAETLGSLVERDSNASGSQSGPNTEPCLEELPRATGTSHEQTQAKSSQQAGQKGSSVAHRVSLDPDPLWVSSLLRKMEKAFMAHLAGATASLRARWSLQGHRLLDQMVAELQQDVGQRLQDSTTRELRKVQSRAGRKAPGPPRVALRWEASQQTEQRRHRLRGLRKLSAFSEQTWARGTPSLSLEDMPNLSGALGTQLGGKAEEEEFCPCEACLRKKVIFASPKDTVGIASLPIREAFDLQQILQKKKGGCTSGETADTAPEKTGVELHQRDPSGTRTVQGADGGPELELGWGAAAMEGDEDKGSQALSSGEDPGGAEEGAAARKRGGNTGPHAGHHPQASEWEDWGVGHKEGNPEEGSGARSPGGQNNGANTVEVQETEGEGQPAWRRGSQGEKQAGPRQGQLGGASGHSSPDQERRPPPAPAASGDTHGQRPGRKTGLSSSRTSSLGNCSQLSHKGSEEGPSNGGMRTFSDEPQGVPGSEGKVTAMYPGSSSSEQEGPSSGSRTPERGTGEGLTPEPRAGQGSDLEAEKVVKRLSGAERKLRNLTIDRTDGFGQDDLDF